MQSLKDYLESTGQPVLSQYRCAGVRPGGQVCGCVGPAWSFYMAEPRERFAFDFVCGRCIDDDRRLQAQEAEAAALPNRTWDSECGNAVRAQRNALIGEWMWAATPGSSLTPDCQADFAAMFAALHRLTIDFATPDAVEWPEIPTLTYL